jgi:hypothetical protein
MNINKNIHQLRIEDQVFVFKTCCYYCSASIADIETAPTIEDYKDNIKNIVCSYKCHGIPDDIKDNCGTCGSLFFANSDVCDSCWGEVESS